jgi:hypothetical protein
MLYRRPDWSYADGQNCVDGGHRHFRPVPTASLTPMAILIAVLRRLLCQRPRYLAIGTYGGRRHDVAVLYTCTTTNIMYEFQMVVFLRLQKEDVPMRPQTRQTHTQINMPPNHILEPINIGYKSINLIILLCVCDCENPKLNTSGRVMPQSSSAPQDNTFII